MRKEFVESVRAVVGMIPVGRVLSYGDIAELLDCGGPRQVGAVMSRSDGELPWWRVVRANGQPPVCHGNSAFVHYREEKTPFRHTGAGAGEGRIRMQEARWQPGDADWTRIDFLRERLGEGAKDSRGAVLSDSDDWLSS